MFALAIRHPLCYAYCDKIGGENVTATNEERILQLLEVMQADISGLKTDVAGLKTDVAGLKTDVAGMKADIAELKASQEELKASQEELKASQEELKASQEEMKEALSEHTVVLNAILEWADECREADRFPLPKIM